MAEPQKQASDQPEAKEREECICDMLMQSFAGPMRWLVVVVWLYGIAFTVVAVWSAVAFFRVQTIRGMILCAALFLASLMIIMLVKLWCWMWMMRGSVLRRIDRLCR